MKSEYLNPTLVAVGKSGPVAVVRLLGEHDMTTTEALAAAINAAAPASVVIDLSEADFVDSSTINVLIRAHDLAVAEERRYVLQLGAAARVRKVFEITGVLEMLPWATDREQAVQIVSGRIESEPNGRDALLVASPSNA